jgi:Zn-finger nucleic acid-binding protein
MQARELGDLVVDECSKCLGLFLDHVAIKAVLADRARGESLLDSLPRHEHSALPKGKMYIRCPSCGTVMNRKLFATGSGVVVDVCRSDGMFFDAGELPAIIDFVLAGGLERAAQRDSEREREQAARERLRKQDLGDGEPRRDRTTALVDLLFNLFG